MVYNNNNTHAHTNTHTQKENEKRNYKSFKLILQCTAPLYSIYYFSFFLEAIEI